MILAQENLSYLFYYYVSFHRPLQYRPYPSDVIFSDKEANESPVS